MNVLITGGAGYIGYELTKCLMNNVAINHITVYDNFLQANYQCLKDLAAANVSVIRADMLDERKLKHALKDIDFVCHLAAVRRAPYNEEYTHLFEQVNHWGTAGLCSLLATSQVSKVIHVSSAAVYGTSSKPFTVADEPMPSTPYAYSKLNGEKQLVRVQPNRDVVILRLGHVFGYSLAMHYGSLINKFNLAMAFHEPLLVHGCGNQIRPYIHIDRVVQSIAYFLSADYQEQAGLYNIYDFNLSINDILQAYQDLSLNFETIHVSQQQRLNDLILSGNELQQFIGKPKEITAYLQQSLLA
ncbi:UDP-galactose-4-epimerase [Legionella beliardensis]|uniref:UDP-galactose-4-epimerase n=1 Tax=Legionella beliardensis TaxID=91822 RepID=A0A378HZN2_9GAMM|nr:SDR family oxidoreductase [Legionella beliardensis]STX27920.1 UDP-galactose-4-epimerase [Legionella beliardensis]